MENLKAHCSEVEKMSDEFVVLVDEHDNPIGLEEKVRCHLPNGQLHRAFTALLFDEQGNLVLAKRSSEKMLWPNIWDGTFASHPRESETFVSSGERRMPEELGIVAGLDYLHKFEYHVAYKDIGSENEICATLIGIIDRSTKLEKIKGEIDEIKWISAEELILKLQKDPLTYCPWMLIALQLLDRSDESILKKHTDVLSPWMGGKIHESLQKAINSHLSEDNWRLVNNEKN